MTRLEAAGIGAVVASAGDLALLWVAWAADGRLALPAAPADALIVGHYAGVLGIPLYASATPRSPTASASRHRVRRRGSRGSDSWAP